MRVFLDANVIFATAISPGGRAQALFTLASAGYGTLLTSVFAAEEARRNVELKYPDASERLQARLDQCLETPAGTPARVIWASGYMPAKDAPILAAAIAARSDLLITGDRAHFGAPYGRTFETTTIVSLSDGLARLSAL